MNLFLLRLSVGSSYPIVVVVSRSLFVTKLGRMRSLCSVMWTLLYFVMAFFWCTNKPRHPLFPFSIPNQRGRFCFLRGTWQSWIRKSKFPCVRGSHLGHRLLPIVTDSGLLCCCEMSLLFSVCGFVNSTDVYPHVFGVFRLNHRSEQSSALLWLHSPRRLGCSLGLTDGGLGGTGFAGGMVCILSLPW